MPAASRRIGAHLPLGGGMVKAADRAAEIGADALQVFSDNPTAWRRRSKPPAELDAFRKRLELLGIGPLAIHASYLINLAGPDEHFHEKSVEVLAHELLTAREYGASFVNVHIGSHRGTGVEAGAQRVAETVARALDRAAAAGGGLDAILTLENSAGGGFGLGASIPELAAVLAAIDARGLPRDRVALTLDTAHLWGAGHDISSAAGVDAFLTTFDAEIGLDRLAMIHLNDARSELASFTDRHQHVGAGAIGPAGMAAILCDPRLLAVPVYLETPGMDDGYDAINVGRCRDLMAGRPLPELPPDALTMPGSRSRSAPVREPGDEEEDDGRRGRRRSRTGSGEVAPESRRPSQERRPGVDGGGGERDA
jgi:deoxyribonuclease-4